MKNETQDGMTRQNADGTVKFELSLVETLSERTTYRYLLNGWVEGFGPRTEEFLNSSHHGPYDCQYWLKGVLPQEVLDTITFDSESSEFYIYSSDRDSLEMIVDVLTDLIERLDVLEFDYTQEKLRVFNGPLPISMWAHPKVHTIGIGDHPLSVTRVGDHPDLPELTSDLPLTNDTKGVIL